MTRVSNSVQFRSSQSGATQRIEAMFHGSPSSIGQVELVYQQGQAMLMNLHVSREYRRYGVGSQLVQRAMASARLRGMPVSLDAKPGADGFSAESLRSMYRRLGFRDAGVERPGSVRMISGAYAPPSSMQCKAIATPQVAGLPGRSAATAPPVYRPGGNASQLRANAAMRLPKIGAPPVYRPQPMAFQAKPHPAVASSYRPAAAALPNVALRAVGNHRERTVAGNQVATPMTRMGWVSPVGWGTSGVRHRVVQPMFSAGGNNYSVPTNYTFSLTSALNATTPIPRGEARTETGRGAQSGVSVGQVGSYGYVQYLEKTGDGLTGDHQPSGAAVKEAIRELLHSSLNRPLTRSMAQNAYKKAITLVVTDAWHKADSRTYGGRNSKSQILQDAQDLVTAAMEDWKKTVQGLRDEGLSDQEIEDVWDALGKARDEFFATGNANKGTL